MSRAHPSARAIALILLTASLLAASTPLAGAGEQGAGRLRWSDCGGAQCATLRVPLDDTNPDDDRTIGLALTRVPARDPDRRIGALVVNPGGPGAPGADFAVDLADSLPGAVRERFDIVGFDPRGVGGSAAIDCADRYDAYYRLEFTPETEQERDALVAGNERFARQCERSDGEMLPYLSTRRTARDLDRIRAALGESRLTYLGYSYGSYLGAAYADQFPTRVRALVLDGGIDPALDGAQTQLQQAVGFERALQLFFEHCADDKSCEFHHGGDPAGAYDRLRARAQRHPIDAGGAGDGRTLNGTLFDIGVAEVLYDGEDGWSTLADDLEAAYDGDGTNLVFDADFYTGRGEDGSYDDVQEAFLAIGCLDGPSLGGVDGVRAIEERAATLAPRLGRSIVNASLPCAFWPVPPEPVVVPRAAGAPPILVLGTLDDPATPLQWSRSLADELESGVLVTADGSRHTAYASHDECIDSLVNRYLVRLEVPRDGTAC